MKHLIINISIYSLMIALMYADEFESIVYAGNVAIFAAWFFIVCGVIALFLPSEELYKNARKFSWLSKSIQYVMIIFMVAIGWTVTGIFYLFVAISLHLKSSVYKNKLKTNSHA